MATIVACLTGVAAFSAHAQSLPRFDVEAHCEDVAEFGGGSHQIYNSCIQMEQSSYNAIRDQWPSVSSRIRNHCQEVAEFGGESYQILESCVQMEENAAGNRESFSFD
ncbi:hypothetical protein [Halomonas llamarensis]|uniref:Uncharacterized protein n=1 Tax=Halomonas llamarensis TaxID=2945104 RepID=A0ABT0STV8_9GAMM|nr:hypothetical protein [Halomonas llamarensis]MCL7931274.1 hypothetical protein [Halomonas llamarensis]